jgi:hypothetical protein
MVRGWQKRVKNETALSLSLLMVSPVDEKGE